MDERIIFEHALELLDASQRIAYLNQACAGDEPLRARVEALLESHEEAGSFLQCQTVEAAVTTCPDATVLAGTTIGPYKLLERIGEGGMGVVYMAQQTEPVKRRVALKIIKPGMDTRQVITRFEAERQTLAMMNHANIAKVLDAGATESGRPYFVMELIKGVPITEYSDNCNLSIHERLKLFVDACHAVQHAHQKGIIHRDIKPSNVLVAMQDGRPTSKIIDFGVAKATNQQLAERSALTGFSQMIGTPLYMSPEQAEMSVLDIDTRTDVYSLGVLLYELLSGTTPFGRERFTSASYDQMRRIIREETPAKPSDRISTLQQALTTVAERRRLDPKRLVHSVRGDLDWITLRALEKDRTRRYETVAALVADVQRYLNDEPVEASPPSAAYRFKKFARRHRLALSTAATVLIALAIGTGVALWQAARAFEAQQFAEAQRDEADKQRERAEWQEAVARQNFERAQAAVTEYLTRVSEEELLDTPGLQPLRKDLLALALKYYREFIAERAGDPDLQAELAAAYFRVGEIVSQIGAKGEALRDHHEALRIFLELSANHPDSTEYRIGLANSYRAVGELQEELGLWQEALQSFRGAVAASEELVQEAPDLTAQCHLLARAYDSIGLLHLKSGELESMMDTFGQSITTWEKLIATEPDVVEYQRGLAVARQNLARGKQEYRRLGIMKEQSEEIEKDAVAELEKSIREQEKRVGESPTIEGWANLANSYFILGDCTKDRQDARRLLTKAVQVYERLIAENPDVSQYRHGLASNLQRLSVAQAGFKRFAGENGSESALWDWHAAVDSLHAAIDIWKRLASDYPEVIDYRDGLAGAYYTLALRMQYKPVVGSENEWVLPSREPQCTEVATLFQHAISLWEELAEQNPSVERYRFHLAESYDHRSSVLERVQPSEAAASLQKAEKIRRGLVQDRPQARNYQSELAMNYHQLGLARKYAGEFEAAIEFFEQAIRIREDLLTNSPGYTRPESQPHYQFLADTYRHLSGAQEAIGLSKEAGISRERAIQSAEQQAAQNPATKGFLVLTLKEIAHELTNIERPDDAVRYLEEALAVQKSLADGSSMSRLLESVYQQLAHTQRLAGDLDAARESCEARVRIREKILEVDPTSTENKRSLASSYLYLAEVQRESSRVSDASESYLKAAEFHLAIDEQDRNWHELGQTLYRLGRWEEARQSLEQGMESQGDEASMLSRGIGSWYLAMALAQLGETKRARSYYTKLTAELHAESSASQIHPSFRRIERQLRKETATLLGICLESDAHAEPSAADEAEPNAIRDHAEK